MQGDTGQSSSVVTNSYSSISRSKRLLK